jgi:hypothetical protein
MTVESIIRKRSVMFDFDTVTVFVAGTRHGRTGIQFRSDTQDTIGWWEPFDKDAEKAARDAAFGKDTQQ